MKKKSFISNVDLFESRGVRGTQCRRVIVEILQRSPGHLTVKDLHREMRKRIPSVGLASVYRNICALGRVGILEKIGISDDGAIFELSEDLHPLGHHHHLICEVCGKVVVYNDFVEKEKECVCEVRQQLAEKFHFSIKGHVLKFIGKCKACQKK